MNSGFRVRKQVLIEVVVCATVLSPLMGDVHRTAAPLAVRGVSSLAALPAINPDDWQSFANALRQRAGRFSGNVGYVVKDLRSGEVVLANEDGVFPSASLI